MALQINLIGFDRSIIWSYLYTNITGNCNFINSLVCNRYVGSEVNVKRKCKRLIACASIVSIVIVNWNTEELLRACLNSIYKTMDKTSIEVIVVDNASSDNSVDMVQREFPMVRLVINQANLGFAKANNIAFPMCSAPYVMLLNSDTTVYPGAVETLIQFLDTHLQVGAVGPKIVHPRLRLKVLDREISPMFKPYSIIILVCHICFLILKRFEGLISIMGYMTKKIWQSNGYQALV